MHKLEAMFKEHFNNVKKLISFNPRWVEPAGDFRRVVSDRACRYILNVGEVVKMTDRHQRQYILVGTPFGMIAAQRTVMFGKTIVRYETTHALVDNYHNFINDDVNFFPGISGILLEQGFSYLVSQQLQDDFKVIADMALEAGRTVGDGIKPPRVPREKATITTNAPPPNKEIWDAAAKRVAHKFKRQQATAAAPAKPDIVNAAPRQYTVGLQDNSTELSGDQQLINSAPMNLPLGTCDTSGPVRARGMTSCIVHYDDAPFQPAPRNKAEPYVAIEA